MSMACNIICLS